MLYMHIIMLYMRIYELYIRTCAVSSGAVVWCPQCASAVCPQLRRVVNQTKGGKKRSMRALVVVGNKDGAAGMYV